MRRPSAPSEKEPPASAAVREEWLRRVEAEYHSCAFAQHLTLWLIQVGASPELISAGLRIAADELAHAQLSHEVFLAAGGTGQLHLGRERLQLRRDESVPLEHDALRACLELFCLGETVAVPLFKNLRQGTTVPVARLVLDRVLVDEVRHRDFGWTLLAWLLSTAHAPSLRQLAHAELPAMLARLYTSYAGNSETAESPGAESELAPQDRAWGLMPAATYATILRRTFQRDFVPRFQRLEITCPPLPDPSDPAFPI